MTRGKRRNGRLRTLRQRPGHQQKRLRRLERGRLAEWRDRPYTVAKLPRAWLDGIWGHGTPQARPGVDALSSLGVAMARLGRKDRK